MATLIIALRGDNMATARPVKFNVKVDLQAHRAATRMLATVIKKSVEEVLPQQVASLCVMTANAIKPDEPQDLERIIRTKAMWRTRINGKARAGRDSTAVNIGMKGRWGRAWRTVHRANGKPIHIPYHDNDFSAQDKWTAGKTSGKPLPENLRSEHNAKVSEYLGSYEGMRRHLDSARYFTKRSFIDIANALCKQGGFTLDQIRPKIRTKDRSKVENATTIMGATHINGSSFINSRTGAFYVRVSNSFPNWKGRRLDAAFGKQIRRQTAQIHRQYWRGIFENSEKMLKAYPWIKARQR